MSTLKRQWIPALTKAAHDHLCEGYLWSEYGENLSTSDRLEFKRQFHSQWAHNQILEKELLEIGFNAQAVVLKGIPLIDRFYKGVLGTRKCGDIDLWVADDNESQLLERELTQRGYRLLIQGTWWGERFKNVWMREANGQEIVVEVHRGKFLYHLPDLSPQVMPWAGQLSVLEPHWEFCYLAGHYAFQHNFSKFIWAVDLAKLITNYRGLDWDKIQWLGTKLKLQNSLEMTLHTLKMFFDFDYPLPQLHNGTRLWQEFLDAEFILEGRSKLWRYWLLKQLSKDDWSTIGRYHASWIWAQSKKRLGFLQQSAT